MKSKVCRYCNKSKELSEFYDCNNSSDGLMRMCKECDKNKAKEYRRTLNGLITNIYGNQVTRSKVKSFPPPEYTKQELTEWLFNETNIRELFAKWVDSGFKKMTVPSIDRLDDYLPYSFDNIRLTTWKINKQKGFDDRKNGINNKASKAVIGIERTTRKIAEFYSAKQAQRELGINNSHIIQCCKGVYKSAGNYVWKYKSNFGEFAPQQKGELSC
jgi:hypothetical protein